MLLAARSAGAPSAEQPAGPAGAALLVCWWTLAAPNLLPLPLPPLCTGLRSGFWSGGWRAASQAAAEGWRRPGSWKPAAASKTASMCAAAAAACASGQVHCAPPPAATLASQQPPSNAYLQTHPAAAETRSSQPDTDPIPCLPVGSCTPVTHAQLRRTQRTQSGLAASPSFRH